ncbi:hypothetical protein [Clostridium perfringens]|uniref:hypothetical protein n=1 Tax=Clostridium perfringens TaxID=1502 RepID=UPI000A5C9798|nr:hypothetical protein [Clostridium perfringens]VTQ55146.1 Uncharacterised protein [Clostridium perfringens]
MNRVDIIRRLIELKKIFLEYENIELKKELELHEWAFEGLRSAYFEKIGEENGD